MKAAETSGDLEAANPAREWLEQAVEQGALDLHLVVGHPPTLRRHGSLEPLSAPALTDDLLHATLTPLCPPSAWGRFRRRRNVDFALQLELAGGVHRFAQLFRQRPQSGRLLSHHPLRDPGVRLGRISCGAGGSIDPLPQRPGVDCRCHRSGQDDHAGHARQPAESGGWLPHHYRGGTDRVRFPRCDHSVVTQREVGHDVRSFAEGLKYGLRQDPDVILVGEIRDRATAQMALSAAETGHLVFSTLHTRDAKGAITHYADLFPQSVQNEIRSQLSMSLRAVISQHLLPSLQQDKRELAWRSCSTTRPLPSRFASARSRPSTRTSSRAAQRDGVAG